MSAEKALREGKLAEAMALLQDEVRKDPSSAKHRVFLFQILAVTGEWDRAMTQLKVAGELDASTLAMVQTYREALRCEVLRSRVFEGGISPTLFGEPEEWVALAMQALRLTADGKHAEAGEVRDRAFEAAPATSGTLNDQPFEWIADADMRLGPIVEAVVNGTYYWIPFHRIRSITIEEPQDLRDVVWMPAEFTWANGGETVGLIPTRYPGSHADDDPLVRLARKTEWAELGPDVYHGRGQRMFATDSGECSLMDVRTVTLETAANEPGDALAE